MTVKTIENIVAGINNAVVPKQVELLPESSQSFSFYGQLGRMVVGLCFNVAPDQNGKDGKR